MSSKAAGPPKGERYSKRRRLLSLTGISRTSHRQFEAILDAVADLQDDDELRLSRWGPVLHLSQNVQLLCERIVRTRPSNPHARTMFLSGHRRYAMMRHDAKKAQQFLTKIELPMRTGAPRTWHLCRIDLLLIYFSERACFFKNVFQECLRRRGRDLTLATYADEIVPGDPFAPDTTRKSWCLYVSVLEFGAALLAREESWLPLAVLRSNIVAKVGGGFSCVLRLLLRSWFCGEPLRLSVEGLTLKLDEPTMFTFRKTKWIFDLDGFRTAFAWRGSSSLRPCFKCRNCLKRGHHSCTATSWQVDIACTEFDRFEKASDADVFEIVDLIANACDDPAIRKKDAKQLQKAHGFNHVPNGHAHIGLSVPPSIDSPPQGAVTHGLP